MSRCVIVGSAQIKDYEKIKSEFNSDDYFVFCDAGLMHKESLGVKADFIVGDFDSHKKPDTTENVLVLPSVKDDTDTFAAVKLMLDKGFDSFLLVGVTGQRLDHTLANISVLLYLKNHGAKAQIIDDYSKMYVLDGQTAIKKDSCSFFSLVALSQKLEGVCIQGAKYCLQDATIDNSYQYAVSNETVDDVKISVQKGDALVVLDF